MIPRGPVPQFRHRLADPVPIIGKIFRLFPLSSYIFPLSSPKHGAATENSVIGQAVSRHTDVGTGFRNPGATRAGAGAEAAVDPNRAGNIASTLPVGPHITAIILVDRSRSDKFFPVGGRPAGN
jgi:hypothetical protein